MRTFTPADSAARKRPARRTLRLEMLETRDVFAAGGLDASFGTGGIVRIENSPSLAEISQQGGNFYVGDGGSSIIKLSAQGVPVTGFGTQGQALISSEVSRPFSTGGVVVAAFGSSPTFGFDSIVRKLAPTGNPDSTFGTNGQTAIDFLDRMANPEAGLAATYETLSDLEVDASNKTWALIYGDLSSSAVGFLSDHFSGIARLNADGTLDSTFGIGGKAVVEMPNDSAFAYTATDLQLTADGGAIMAGVYTENGAASVVLYKFKANGTLETNFGTAGKLSLAPLGTVAASTQVHLAADGSSGKFYVGSYAQVTGSVELRLARITAAGVLDTYGTGGVVLVGNVETDAADAARDDFALTVQADGKPVLVFGGPDWNVKRLKTGGAADADFGVNGVVTTSFGSDVGAFATPQSVLIQSTGQIVVSGKFKANSGAATETVVARYQAVDVGVGPSSSVTALAATTYTNNLTVNWSGTPIGGTTITGYDIYYRVANGTPVLWKSNVTATSAVFNETAARRKSVSFYSIARDSLGAVEAAPANDDAVTNYIGAPWQNPDDMFDVVTGGADTGAIDPSDILTVIYEYNTHEISSASTSEVILPPTRTYPKGYYVDVDGDNLITPSDILFVILRYNQITGGGEGEAAAVVATIATPTAAFVFATDAAAEAEAITVAPPAVTGEQAVSSAATDDDLLTQLAYAYLLAQDDDAA